MSEFLSPSPINPAIERRANKELVLSLPDIILYEQSTNGLDIRPGMATTAIKMGDEGQLAAVLQYMDIPEDKAIEMMYTAMENRARYVRRNARRRLFHREFLTGLSEWGQARRLHVAARRFLHEAKNRL